MRNWKISPKDSNVARYVECYWFLEKESDDTTTSFPKLNPDPAAHLILANAQNNFQYVANKAIQNGTGSHLIYPHGKTFVMDHSQPFMIVGIKFKIGALYSMALTTSQLQLDKIANVDFNTLIQSESFSTMEFLTKNRDNPHKACEILDDKLAYLVFDNHEDKHSELVRNILPLLENMPISNIGETLHCSQRTVERSFLRVTQMRLKQCQSMIRLEAILDYVYGLSDGHCDWADIAVKFDFSDQPHLIRYLKSKIGTTPGDYLKQRDLTIDIYGNFE